MNSFFNAEFWLALAFFIVFGMIVFSPIRRVIQKSLIHQKQVIQDKINQSNAVYKEAKELYKKTLKDFKTPYKNHEINDQIKDIDAEFSKKEKTLIENKNQNFQIQKQLITAQVKNHLRTQLLQRMTFKISNSKHSRHITTQEIQHFVKVLHESKDFLNQNL